MKKIVMTLAAALCCTMTTSGFIACGGYYEPPEPQTPEEQEEPAEEPEKKAPATVKVQFFVENKADMLNYLDIVVKCSNGQRVFYSPVLDAFTTALSIVGIWALARKYLEQWFVWIVVDVVTCGLYFYKDIPFKASLYGVYVIIAVFGYFKWRKLMEEGNKEVN